jgi:hypothetical protein
VPVDEAHRCHRNFGQVGYALQNQETPDRRGAEEALTEAIRIRDGHGIGGFRLYEFVRARCRAALDGSAGRSPEDVRQKVLADLRAVADSFTVRRDNLIRDTPELADWLERNGLDAGLN